MPSAVTLAGTCVLAVALGAGRAAAERQPVRIYTTAEGLANGRVIDATEDARGFLWFATLDGLSRFDGNRFESFGVADGVPDTSCNDVLATHDGVLWVATDRGVARLDPDAPGIRPRFTPIALGAPEDVAFRLFEDSADVLWIGASSGLWRVPSSGAAPEAVPLALDGVPYVFVIAEDRDRSLWLGTSSGLVRRVPDGTTTHVRFTAAGTADDRTTALLVDHAGRLWVGAANEGLVAMVPPPPDASIVPDSIWEAGARNGRALGADGVLRVPQTPGEIVRYTLDDGFPIGGVRRLIFEDSHGTMWFGARGYLMRLEHGRFDVMGPRQGFPPEDFAPFLEDAAGNLWFGGNTTGVARLSARRIVTFDDADGLESVHVYAFTEDAAGALYAISFRDGFTLNRFDGKRFTSVRPRFPPDREGIGAWGWHQIAFPDRDGRWWYSTAEGVAHYPAVRFEDLANTVPEFFGVRDGLPGRDVFRVFQDSRGDVWIATMSETGLARWDHATNRITPVVDPALPATIPTAFLEDPAKNLWIAYEDGRLARLPGGSTTGLRVFAAADGLPDRFIHALLLDHLGRLWLATSGGGVLRLDDPGADHLAPVRYTIATGLSTDQATALAEDEFGHVYVGTVRGVDRIDPRQGEIEHLSTADGIPNGYVMTAYRDRRGVVWIGTHGGVARILPDNAPPQAPPPAYLVSLVAGGVPRALAMGGARTGPSLTLAHDEGQLDIEFTSPSFAGGTPVLFQTRLDGADTDWSAPSPTREVHYAHLAPGHYRFWVRAVFPGGPVSEPASLAFEVEAPMWRRPWFLALAAALLALIAWRLYRMRVARLLAVERVRTRIATDLHDDLGSSLSRIAILAEVAARRAPGDDEVVGDIGKSARELVDVAADIVWSTDPRRDDLGSLLVRVRSFASDVLEGRDIAWTLDAPEAPERIALGPDPRRHLYLVLKEAINNAARHSGARRVTIVIAVAGDHLTASVTDDGGGIDPERPSRGNGLGNMRDRARQAGGTLAVEAAPGGGTVVTLRIPVA